MQLAFWGPEPYLDGQGAGLAPPSQSWESGLKAQGAKEG